MIWELTATLNLKMSLQLREREKRERRGQEKQWQALSRQHWERFIVPFIFFYFLIRHPEKDQVFCILMSCLVDRIRPRSWLTTSRPDLGQIDVCGEQSFITKQI